MLKNVAFYGRIPYTFIYSLYNYRYIPNLLVPLVKVPGEGKADYVHALLNEHLQVCLYLKASYFKLILR